MLNAAFRQFNYYCGRVRFHIPQSMYLKLTYLERTGKRLNLRHPVTFGDKIQWLKLNYRKKEQIELADKYLVREHIAKAVGQQYLIPNYDVYDTAEEIDFDTLPQSFIIKPNHGSGWYIRCPDKSQLDWSEARMKLARWMQQDYSVMGKEWHYAYMKRKILCQTLLLPKPPEPLVEYQIFCTDGKVRFCQADLGPMDARMRFFYDPEWKKMSVRHRYPARTDELARPQCWDEMLHVATTLSKGLPFVRVDLYNLDQRVYFGELTFTPGGGYNQYEPEEFNTTIGQWITLPKPCRKLVL